MQALASSVPAASKTSQPRDRELVVRRPGEGDATWFLDNLIVTKVSGRDGAPLSLLEASLPAGSHTPLHRHLDEDEAFYILEGEITYYLEGGQVVRATAGAYVHIPRGMAHGFRTETAIRMLVITGPDGFAEMTRDAGIVAPRRELPPQQPPTPAQLEQLGRAAHARRIELLGPLPE